MFLPPRASRGLHQQRERRVTVVTKQRAEGQSPDEVQRLVLVPEAPAGPALVQQVPVVLGAVRFDGVAALVSTLVRGQRRTQVRAFFFMSLCFLQRSSTMWETQEADVSHLVRRKRGLVRVVSQQAVDSCRGQHSEHSVAPAVPTVCFCGCIMQRAGGAEGLAERGNAAHRETQRVGGTSCGYEHLDVRLVSAAVRG